MGIMETPSGWAWIFYGSEGGRFALSRDCPHLRIEIWGTRFCGFDLVGLLRFIPLAASERQNVQTTLTKALLTFFNVLASRIGGSPKNLLYSRLNWLTLS